MLLTRGQKKDIETCLYFCPEKYRRDVTDKEIGEFLDWSERGAGDYEAKFSTSPLILGKSRRGLHISLWEQGVLDGSVPYLTLLGAYANTKKWWQFWVSNHRPIPRSVVDFMKKEMFRGQDADTIERTYQSLPSY